MIEAIRVACPDKCRRSRLIQAESTLHVELVVPGRPVHGPEVGDAEAGSALGKEATVFSEQACSRAEGFAQHEVGLVLEGATGVQEQQGLHAHYLPAPFDRISPGHPEDGLDAGARYGLAAGGKIHGPYECDLKLLDCRKLVLEADLGQI